MKQPDVMELDFDDADVLAFIVEMLFDDIREDPRKAKGIFASKYQLRAAKAAGRKLEKFVRDRRCGVTGPANSLGDWPGCTRRKHPDNEQHACRDSGTGSMMRWRGDRASEYFAGLEKHPGITVKAS